ncbi:MAG: hypothetical protein R3A52_06945 [Polyangiales bacterium]
MAAQAEALLHVDPPACIDGAQVDVLAGASRQDGVVPLSMNERHCIEREASETKTPKKGCRERGEME